VGTARVSAQRNPAAGLARQVGYGTFLATISPQESLVPTLTFLRACQVREIHDYNRSFQVERMLVFYRQTNYEPFHRPHRTNVRIPPKNASRHRPTGGDEGVAGSESYVRTRDS